MTENEHTGHRKRMKARFCAADETGTVGSSFSEHELLELLLFYAQPRVNTNETAHRLIRQYGGLQGLMQAPLTSLTQVVGVGKDTALFLRLLASVYRMTMMPGGGAQRSFRMTGTEDLIPYIRQMYFSETPEEHVFLMLFEADGTHKKTVRIADGTSLSASFDPVRCVQIAVRQNTPMVVLVHNHPAAGGPSEEDLRLTNELKTALEYAGVTLMEHFIFSENECYAVMRRKVYT
ncbi:MAG: JAB domain-containing protein [Clostridia bacterium]|nr:JAB domain-containing protein [Clostridia bacterium]